MNPNCTPANHNGTCGCRVSDPQTTKYLEKIKEHCSTPSGTHDYFSRPNTMASEPSQPPPPDTNERPPGPSRNRTAVENLLPAGMVRRGSKRPAQTPELERSVSSMADRFIDYWGKSSRNPPDVDGAKTPELKDDSLTPISNWAHLNYMKTQRNSLRAELKAHQAAGAEAKRSVASLRRLAFRMAVNISVKERKIATSARNLASSRKSGYLEGKDAEKRVEDLRRALRIEEGRNKEMLEALERASMLTLQYANPSTISRTALSPPPSPPTRLSNLAMTSIAAPQTPPQSTSSSWAENDWNHTPRLDSPTDIRTSDSRLMRAKRESDQALTVCRRRINDLQAECTRSKENGQMLEASKISLEREIVDHRTRIASLEQARALVEETLGSTRLQLELSSGMEDSLKQKLRAKNMQLTGLLQGSEDRQQQISVLQEEKSALLMQLEERNTQMKELETRILALEQSLKTSEDKLQSAERDEASLRVQLQAKESANADLERRLNHGSKYEQILQKRIAEYEQDILRNLNKIEVEDGLISTLREQLRQSESNKRDTKDALTTLRLELSNLKVHHEMAAEERKGLLQELEAVRSAKGNIEADLSSSKHALEKEKADKTRVQTDVVALRSTKDELHARLEAAQRRIQSLERVGDASRTNFELLRDEKASIEADLKEARQSLFMLREHERMHESKLREMKSSESSFRKQLRESKEHASVLEGDIIQARAEKTAEEERRQEQELMYAEQHRELQMSMNSLQASLQASDTLRASLREELDHLNLSNSNVESQLTDALQSKNDLQRDLDTVRLDIEYARSENNHLETKVSKLEAALDASRKSHADVEAHAGSLRDEREALKKSLLELEVAVAESRDARAKAEESLRTIQLNGESSGIEVASLQEHLSVAQEAKREAESKVDEVARAKADLESRLLSVQSTLAETDTDQSHAQLDLSALREQVAETLRSRDEVRDRLQRSIHAQEERQQQLDAVQSQLQKLESESATLKCELSTKDGELENSHIERLAIGKKLSDVAQAHTRLEEGLATMREQRVDLESKLASTSARLDNAEAERSRAASKLADTDTELNKVRQGESEAQGKLNDALATAKTLEKQLMATRNDIKEFESRQASLLAQLADARSELADVLERNKQVDESTRRENSSDHQLLERLKSEKAKLIGEVAQGEEEMARLRESNVRLEELMKEASERYDHVQTELRAAHERLETFEAENATLRTKLIESVQRLNTVRHSNSKLTQSKRDMSTRLATTEKELQSVQDTNKRLEVLLERVEQDMARAESAFEESEKRLEAFVDESQEKLDAARSAKLKYKRRLFERTNEINILLDESSLLHKQVGDQRRELSILVEGKEELEALLVEKESFVNGIRSSTDKRLTSMNAAYNKLRSKYEKQLEEQQRTSTSHLQNELQTKDATINDLRPEMGGSGPALTALEQEVQALREDKKAFERLVATLHKKIRYLETLDEAHEPIEKVNSAKLGPHLVPSVASSRHIGGSRHERVLSDPPSAPAIIRPRLQATQASAWSKQEDLDAWRNEIERIRKIKFDQANELRDNKKQRSVLRRSLRDSKAQLHQMEKNAKKPVRQSTVLRKERPATAHRPVSAMGPDEMKAAPATPSRPATSAGLQSFSPDTPRSHHAIHFLRDTPDCPNTSTSFPVARPERPQTSSPLSSHTRWSTLQRAKTHRPATSAGLERERPTTSAGERAFGEHKEKRKWSLRSIFTGR